MLERLWKFIPEEYVCKAARLQWGIHVVLFGVVDQQPQSFVE